MKSYTRRILLYILGFLTWTDIFDDVSAQTSCVISPNFTNLTIRDGVVRVVELHCQCMDGNGIITGTRWFAGNTLVPQSNTSRPYSTNTVPSRLLISAPFTNADNGTYTCSPNDTFPNIPPGDAITLGAASPRPSQHFCTIMLTNPMAAAGGVIPRGTQNVILYCICTINNTAVGSTWWFFNGVSVNLTEDDGSGNPYFRDNVPSVLIIPSFVTPHNGTYSCGPGNNFNAVSSYGDTITLELPVPAPSNFRYTSVASNSITFQWNPLSGNVQVSWYVITCFEGIINNYLTQPVQTNVTGTSTTGTINGLSPFTNYSCTIYAVIMTSDGLMSDPIVVRTAEAVAAPSNFRYTSVTSNSITFQWNPLSGDVQVTWYVITCFERINLTQPVQTNVTGTSTTETVNGLSPFTNYSCTVYAVIMTSDGPMSDLIVVRTAEAAPSPPVINAVTATDSTSVRVEWNIPTNRNGMLTIYTIVYNIEGDSNRTVNVPYNGQLTQSYDITGLSPYQLVTVTITATNGGGTSDPSIAKDGRSGEAVAGVVEIAGVVGTSDSTAIVFWAHPSQPNGVITGYQIIYSLYGDTTNSINQAVTSNEDSFVITSLSAGIPYQVVVAAFNSRGSGAENQPQTFFSQELIPTGSPQNVMINRISGEYVNISWDTLTLSEARGFLIYTVTLTPSTSNDDTNRVIVMNTTESSIVVGGLDVNIEYTLTVAVGTTAGQIMSDRDLVIMKPTSQTSGCNNNDNNTTGLSVIFIALFVIAAVINILLIILIIYFVVKARKNSYSPNDAAHIYDAVELHQKSIKSSSISDNEVSSVSSSSKIPSTKRSQQDIKVDAVELQQNPAYVTKDEYLEMY